MKTLLLFLLLFPISVFAQTNFGVATGTILRSSTAQTYTNNVTTDQALITSTVKANTMTVDRPYVFTCDLSMNTAILTLPNVSFNVKLGAKSLTFITNAVPAISLSNTAMTVTGYIVLRANGDVLVKFSSSPTGTGVNPLGLTTANTTQFAVWTGVNTGIDNTFSVNVNFNSTLGTISVVRQYYSRSEF